MSEDKDRIIEQLQGKLEHGTAKYFSCLAHCKKLQEEVDMLRAQLANQGQTAHQGSHNYGAQFVATGPVTVNQIHITQNPFDPLATSLTKQNAAVLPKNATKPIKPPSYRDVCQRSIYQAGRGCDRDRCEFVHQDQVELYEDVIATLPLYEKRGKGLEKGGEGA